MLGVGIDWSEEFHLVAVGRTGEGVIEVIRVEHSPKAVDALVARVAELEPDPGEVRVVIETRHGLLVERLVDAGYVVVPVNPDLVARRRGPAKKKDDAEDARIACLIALDRHERLRSLIPHGEIAGELRAIARDDERAARDERRLANRLRQDLISTFPAAVQIGGEDLGAPTFLRLLERWPTANALAGVSRAELVAFARSCRHARPERFADKVEASLVAGALQAQGLPGAGQGRRHPPGRDPAGVDRSAARDLGATHGRAPARCAAARARSPTQRRRVGQGLSWRRDLPELSGPR